MRFRNALVDRLGHPHEPFDPDAHPDRVNLGCGYDKRPGFLNVDLQEFHAPDLVADVRMLPQLPSGRYTQVVAQDVLEHLERADAHTALAEWRRISADGGALALRVPDLPSLLRWLQREDDVDHQRKVIHHMFGTQAYSGDFHLNGFTDLVLCDELFRAGFGAVEMELRDEWLWDVKATAGAPPYGLVWGPGFYPREPDGLRWAGTEAELVVCSGAGHPVDAVVALDLSRHPDARTELSLEGPGTVETVALAEEPVHLELRVAAAPGATRFLLRTEGEPASDGRLLAFRVLGGAALA
jgi:hypothetical protein